MNKNGLEVKRYLYEPLSRALDDAFHGIRQQEGSKTIDFIIYFENDGINLYYRIPDHKGFQKAGFSELEEVADSYASLARQESGLFSMERFSYNGTMGICYFLSSMEPWGSRVAQLSGVLFQLFFMIVVFMTIATLVLIDLIMDIQKLSAITGRFKVMDFETPIKQSKKRELSEVFSSLEDVRKEISSNRKKESLVLLSITHDLKTPLTSIKGYVEAFQDKLFKTEEAKDRAFSIIQKKADLLQNRIDELLNMTSLITVSSENKGEIIDVRSWIGDIEQYFAEEAQIHERVFSCINMLDNPLTLKGSSQVLSRVVMNVFDNASRYSKKGDSIRMTTEYKKKWKQIVIKVEDSGPGIQQEDLDSIFELFYKADKSRNSVGTGIGLFMVRYLLELYNGKIKYFPSPLGGAGFMITLPAESKQR